MKQKEAKDLHELADSIQILAEIVNTLVDTMVSITEEVKNSQEEQLNLRNQLNETELILEAVTDGFTDVPTETV